MTVSPTPDSIALVRLAAVLPPGILSHDAETLSRHAEDWSGDYKGRPLAVARPRSTGEVSAVLRACTQLKIPVVPQGGLTGLVGAAVPADEAELVISLDRMRAIRSVSPMDFAMVVEAGCVLEDAKVAADREGCLLPIGFGAQGSCRIGGVVATNAGGWNVLRYGMTRDLVLGLEVVLADGQVWNGLKLLRKDNRGYDLKQLFIGSEGTLGVITAAALKLFPRPLQIETALIGLRSVEDAMALYAHIRSACSDLATAFELLLRDAVEVSLNTDPALSDPLREPYPVYVLLELSSGSGFDLRAMLEDALAAVPDIVVDGVVAQSREQAARLWRLREVMVEHQGRGGPYMRTDISLPISQIAAFVATIVPELNRACPNSGVMVYGHIGDGNLHINVVPPPGMVATDREALFDAGRETVFGLLDAFNGSLSAEHGIGRQKRDPFIRRLDPASLAMAVGLKRLLDPDRLLSMDRVLPSTLLGARTS